MNIMPLRPPNPDTNTQSSDNLNMLALKVNTVQCRIQNPVWSSIFFNIEHLLKCFWGKLKRYGDSFFFRVITETDETGFSSRMPGFALRVVHVRFVVFRVGMGKVFLLFLSTVLRIHSHVMVWRGVRPISTETYRTQQLTNTPFACCLDC